MMRSSVKLMTSLSIILLFCAMGIVVAAPYQELPPRGGHIPVYIREGNQPLSEIHPGLAEAFHEVDEEAKQPLVDNAKTLNANEAKSKESQNEQQTASKVPNSVETDIASFDVVKNADFKNDAPTEAAVVEETAKQSENGVKKENEKKA